MEIIMICSMLEIRETVKQQELQALIKARETRQKSSTPKDGQIFVTFS